MTHHRLRPETAAAARDYGNLFCIWRLCGKTACLRAQRCRGDGGTCFARCFPLLPLEVQNFFCGLGEAQKAGLTWEEALEKLAEEWEVVGEWCGIVADSLTSSRRPAKAKPRNDARHETELSPPRQHR